MLFAFGLVCGFLLGACCLGLLAYRALQRQRVEQADLLTRLFVQSELQASSQFDLALRAMDYLKSERISDVVNAEATRKYNDATVGTLQDQLAIFSQRERARQEMTPATVRTISGEEIPINEIEVL